MQKLVIQYAKKSGLKPLSVMIQRTTFVGIITLAVNPACNFTKVEMVNLKKSVKKLRRKNEKRNGDGGDDDEVAWFGFSVACVRET